MSYIGIRATGDSWGNREERKYELRRRLHHQDHTLIALGLADSEEALLTPYRHRGRKRVHSPQVGWDEYAHLQVALGSAYFLRHHAAACYDPRCLQAIAALREEERIHQERTQGRRKTGELQRLLGSE